MRASLNVAELKLLVDFERDVIELEELARGQEPYVGLPGAAASAMLLVA
jgi:hypothetical protein